MFASSVAALAFLSYVAAQASQWGQCGGIGWTGPTTCPAGWSCNELNPYYSQCLQGAAPSPTAAPPPPTTSAPTTAPTTTGGTPTTTVTAPSGTAAVCGAVASTIPSYNNAKLPDPFTFNNGTLVRTKDDWACRRQEISALIQGYEAGTLPPKPPVVSATFSKSGNSGTLTITAGLSDSQKITFAPRITYPSGNPPAAGWPLIITYEGGSIPIPAGIATLTYSNSDMAQQNDASSRGKGLFYNLYGSGHSASAMTAWAWGVSRIIDALEITPTAQINTQRIGVTGCSRDGKGALMAGAFEERIALTIPQESGSGGDACWRLSNYELNNGNQVQDAVEIVGENVWFSTNFNNYVNNLAVIPEDHHLLAALVAPRAMISFENTDYMWLSPMSSFGCMTAAHSVWQALGVTDNHGFAQVGGHAHCAWPSSLTPQLNSFINKFLLDQSASTEVFTTNNQFGNVQWNAANWITWTTPTLS